MESSWPPVSAHAGHSRQCTSPSSARIESASGGRVVYSRTRTSCAAAMFGDKAHHTRMIRELFTAPIHFSRRRQTKRAPRPPHLRRSPAPNKRPQQSRGSPSAYTRQKIHASLQSPAKPPSPSFQQSSRPARLLHAPCHTSPTALIQQKRQSQCPPDPRHSSSAVQASCKLPAVPVALLQFLGRPRLRVATSLDPLAFRCGRSLLLSPARSVNPTPLAEKPAPAPDRSILSPPPRNRSCTNTQSPPLHSNPQSNS